MCSSPADVSCCRARASEIRSHERGSAVLETAIAIPALIAITMALLWVISMGVTHQRADAAAYAGARLAARGATDDAVRAVVVERLSTAEVTVVEDSDTVTVTVTDHVLAQVPILRGMTGDVIARATVARESP